MISKTQDIKKKIDAAIEAVKDYDEPYRTKAFEVILSKSLELPPTERIVKPPKKRRKTCLY